MRRLIYAVILLIGIAIALSEFTGIYNSPRSLLASGAIAAAIIGFAARQMLANFVAGIMLAITQPIRVGDWVTFEGNYGVVEDVRLNYTILRTADRAADRDPEREAGRRDPARTTRWWSTSSRSTSSVWLPPEADVERAIAALREETGQDVTRRRGRPVGHAAGRRRGPGARRPSAAAREAALRRTMSRALARRRPASRVSADRTRTPVVRP